MKVSLGPTANRELTGHRVCVDVICGFPEESLVKNLPANAGDWGSILGSGKIPWKRKWQLIPICLENSMDRGAWRATVHGVIKELDMT